jgi:hypothetical protein
MIHPTKENLLAFLEDGKQVKTTEFKKSFLDSHQVEARLLNMLDNGFLAEPKFGVWKITESGRLHLQQLIMQRQAAEEKAASQRTQKAMFG